MGETPSIPRLLALLRDSGDAREHSIYAILIPRLILMEQFLLSVRMDENYVFVSHREAGS